MAEVILLNETETARFLGVQAKTLSAWRCRGTGPIFRKVGRLVRYVRTDLEQYLEEQARRSTSEKCLDRSQDRNLMRANLLI